VTEPLPEPFRCDVESMDGWIRVRLHGEVDLATVDRLDAALRELRETDSDRIELDLGEVSFLDSMGLRLLLRLDEDARRDGTQLRLLPGPPGVQRVFEVTGTLDRLPFADRPARGRPPG
jgi:anti-anti-sigma factor